MRYCAVGIDNCRRSGLRCPHGHRHSGTRLHRRRAHRRRRLRDERPVSIWTAVVDWLLNLVAILQAVPVWYWL